MASASAGVAWRCTERAYRFGGEMTVHSVPARAILSLRVIGHLLDRKGGRVGHDPKGQFRVPYREPSWPREYWVEILLLALGLVAVNLIFIADAFRATDTLNPTSAGQLGDFVGGYVGTFFALASVVLLSATLRSQRKSAQVLNFEGKYFELLRLHRDNVAELEVQGVNGRKLFVVLIREYRAAAGVVLRLAEEKQQHLTPRQLAHITYYCLFFGAGPHSSRMLRHSLSEYDEALVDAVAEELDRSDIKKSVQGERKLAYLPFEGHQSRLGHYYRHLYQAIRYVDEQKLAIDKYQYVKTIRAQLSNHEQVLLLLNSLTPMGENWWKNGYMLKYRLVQNIPRNFFDRETELDLSTLFEAGYFEWEESRGAI